MKNLAELIPDFAKPVLRPLYDRLALSRPYRVLWRFCDKLPPPNQTSYFLDYYWQSRSQPWGEGDPQQYYAIREAQGRFLVEIIQRYAAPDAKILDIGCGVGTSLNELFLSNFKSLEGIEVSGKTVQLLKQTYPEMAQHAKLHNTHIEEVIKDFKDRQFDIVFTVAVLMMIHSDSEWIFPELVRITKCLITVENEVDVLWGRVVRNYK